MVEDIGIIGFFWLSVLLFILIIAYLFYFLLPYIIVIAVVYHFWVNK